MDTLHALYVVSNSKDTNVANETKQLKLFIANHDGKYVFGISAVVASSKQTARKMVLKELARLKIGTDFLGEELELEQIDLTKPAVHVLFDGAY